VVDTAGTEGRNPIQDIQNLRRELDLYDARLSTRPWFIVANKMDLPEAVENLDALRKKFKVDIVAISAAKGEGIDELKKKLATWLE
jgi:GTP-binding protein